MTNRRLILQRKQRSAGHHLFGPFWLDTEWHNYNKVRYFNITVGNPKVHYNWAFSLWVYFTR